MTAEPFPDADATPSDDDPSFDAAQQRLLVEVGQALIAQSTAGTVALELVVTQVMEGQNVDLDFRLNLERQSGLTVPAAAEDALVDTVQRLVLLRQEHSRDPWRTFTYRLTRGETGPRFTSEFAF
ncbi:MAG: hypothetical protein ACRDJE_06470 [Dehalococcoidia bacterium]